MYPATPKTVFSHRREALRVERSAAHLAELEGELNDALTTGQRDGSAPDAFLYWAVDHAAQSHELLKDICDYELI